MTTKTAQITSALAAPATGFTAVQAVHYGGWWAAVAAVAATIMGYAWAAQDR